MNNKLPNVEAVIDAIRDYNGNLAAVGRKFGCTRQAVDQYVKNHPTARAACAESRETMLDNAESILYKKVLAGDTQELLFFLRTQGKSRGYTERVEQEHSGPNGGPIQTTTRYAEMSDDELDGRIAELESQRAAGIPTPARGAEPPPD